MASQLESGLCGIKHEQNKIVNSFLLNDWTEELAIISSIVYEMIVCRNSPIPTLEASS